MPSENKFKRRVDHLPSHALACLEAVSDLFDPAWLKKGGTHRLQLLWRRKDPLATNELFVLGNAIEKLRPKNFAWLEGTAKSIKRDAATSHGHLFEILVCGAIEGNNGAKTLPSPQGKPGVDLTVQFLDGFKYEVSVKNHDISIHERNFRQQANNLDAVFLAKLKAIGKIGRLFVSCESHMSELDFMRCAEAVENFDFSNGRYDVDRDRLSMVFREFLEESGREFSQKLASSLCIVTCPPHPNDRLNFRDKVLIASKNMRKHLKRTPNNFLLLRMRVHASADIVDLKNVAQDLLENDEDCGFDGVLLTQAYCVRKQGRTEIYTCYQTAMSTQRESIIRAGKAGDRLNIQLGLGSIGQSPSVVQFDVGDGHPMTLHPSHYFYQRGDYYYLMKQDAGSFSGEVNSPASGIHVHSVWKNSGGELLMSSISPPIEELLLI